nr:complement factor D-like [Penaeus vannamei]
MITLLEDEAALPPSTNTASILNIEQSHGRRHHFLIFSARIPPIKVTAAKTFTPSNRIVGGGEAEPHKHGFQAALMDSGHFFCGGGVISDQFLLTVAHCVPEKRNVEMQVLVGGHNLEVKESTRQIRESIYSSELFTRRGHSERHSCFETETEDVYQ